MVRPNKTEDREPYSPNAAKVFLLECWRVGMFEAVKPTKSSIPTLHYSDGPINLFRLCRVGLKSGGKDLYFGGNKRHDKLVKNGTFGTFKPTLVLLY